MHVFGAWMRRWRYTGVLGYMGNDIMAIDINEAQVTARKRIGDLAFENVEVQLYRRLRILGK
jgi:hypothetical protein